MRDNHGGTVEEETLVIFFFFFFAPTRRTGVAGRLVLGAEK